MFGQIGGLNAVGAPLPNNQIGGESFIRHIGNDKLIFDFHEGSGTVVHDKSHCGNNGTLGAGAAAPTWKRNSLYFNGSNYVDLTGISHRISTGECAFIFSFSNIRSNDYFFDQKIDRLQIRNHENAIKIWTGVSLKTLTDTGIDAVSPLLIQITRDNSGNLECYINEKKEGKGQTDIRDITYDGTSILVLGTNYGLVGYILTTMYSFRILNKGLSGIECQQEYLANKFRGNN